MSKPQRDIWSEWMLNRRFAGDLNRLKTLMDYLYPIRDKVLANTSLSDGGTLLDVGCGDGLIAFGALEKYATANVIFSDISQDLIEHAEKLAEQIGMADRCRFVCASADNLPALSDDCVDAVT